MKNFKKILGNQQGMSLIEVIVAAAISVIVSGAVMKTNENGIRGMNAVSTRISLDMWKSSVLIGKYNDPVACMANYQNLGAGWTTGGGVSGGTIYENDGATAYLNANDSIVGTSGDWTFISVRYEPFSAFPTTPTKGSCDALIRVRNNKSSLTAGTAEKQIRIPVTCNLDSGATTLISCSGSSDGLDSLWGTQLAQSAPDRPEYVYRNGNVLIGPGGQLASAPFQISITDTNEWPISSGSGVTPSMKIAGQNHALIFEAGGLYEDASDCLNIALDDGTANLINMSKACAHALYLGTDGATVVNNGAGKANVAIASAASSVDGGYSTIISSSNSSTTSGHATVIGSQFSLAQGSFSSVISSSGTAGFESRATGTNSVVLGASNVTVGGSYSMGTGIDNIVSGSNSFTLGSNNLVSGNSSMSVGGSNTVSGGGSLAVGSANLASGGASLAMGQSSQATGYDSTAIGWNVDTLADRARGMGSHIDITPSGSYSVAIGYDLTVSASASMALGYGATASNRTGQSRTKNFLAMFDNGFDFKTDPLDQYNENKNVYIDGAANMGIGKDIQYVAASSFDGGVKPKLYVNGKTEINGALIVHVAGSAIKTASWTTATLASGWNHYSGLELQYLKDPFGFVHLRGGVQCTAGDTSCLWSGTNGTSKVMNLPAGHGYPRILAAYTCAHRYNTGSTISHSSTWASLKSIGCGVHLYNNTLHLYSGRAKTLYPMLDGITWKMD